MGIDSEAALALDLTDSTIDPGIVHLGRSAAAGADHMVMMSWRTWDVRMLAVRQIQPLDDAELDEQLERPEQGGTADREAPVAGCGGQVGGGEMTIVCRDQVRQRKPRRGQAVTRVIQG